MIDVKTKDDLRRALHGNENIIHVVARNLCLKIIKRPYEFRRILFAYHSQGYRLIKWMCFGLFDVKLVRKETLK